VLAWIHGGELAAANVSAGSGRPTWRVSEADLDRFLAGRRAVPASAGRKLRRKRPAEVIEFF
jgi:hypothetical protein